MDNLINENELNDSYILKEDKLNLIRTIKNIYIKKFPWADDALMRVLIREHYKQTINNMNEEDYINEIKNNNVDNLIESI